MLEPAYQADVVVVGAGVAGLAAAHRLISAGVTTAVLEAAPYVGGRMSTEKVDGFRLDRIGQFLSTSYPELRLTPGLDALVLRPFAPGVLLHSDGRHHHAGTPAPGGSARGAFHAVRALASAPRSGTVRKGPLWGGPVTRGRGGVSWAAAAPGGRATLGDRTEGAYGDGAGPDQAATRGALRGRAGSSWGGPALRDRAGSTWGGLASKGRTGPSWSALTPRNRADSSWGGPAFKDRSAVIPGSSTVPRPRSTAPSAAPSTRHGSAPH